MLETAEGGCTLWRDSTRDPLDALRPLAGHA